MKLNKSLFLLAVVLAWIVLLSECCGKKKTPGDEVAEKTEEMAGLAEKENLEGISLLLAAEYQDADGRERRETLEMMADIFERSSGIVIHVLNMETRTAGSGNAIVEVETLISQGAAMALRRLAKMTGRYYLFTIQWKQVQEEWRVVWAKWEEIHEGGLSSKALEKAEKILPGE